MLHASNKTTVKSHTRADVYHSQHDRITQPLPSAPSTSRGLSRNRDNPFLLTELTTAEDLSLCQTPLPNPPLRYHAPQAPRHGASSSLGGKRRQGRHPCTPPPHREEKATPLQTQRELRASYPGPTRVARKSPLTNQSILTFRPPSPNLPSPKVSPLLSGPRRRRPCAWRAGSRRSG